jgi:hypothetical protein
MMAMTMDTPDFFRASFLFGLPAQVLISNPQRMLSNSIHQGYENRTD